MVKDGVQFTAGRAGVTLLIDRAYSSLPLAAAPVRVSVPPPPLMKEESKSRRLKPKKDKAVKPHRKEKKGREEHKSRAAATTAAAVVETFNSEGGAVEERARQLAEQRDDTVHSSMAKVQVVTLHL